MWKSDVLIFNFARKFHLTWIILDLEFTRFYQISGLLIDCDASIFCGTQVNIWKCLFFSVCVSAMMQMQAITPEYDFSSAACPLSLESGTTLKKKKKGFWLFMLLLDLAIWVKEAGKMLMLFLVVREQVSVRRTERGDSAVRKCQVESRNLLSLISIR